MYKVKREEYIENRTSNSRSFVLSGVHMGMFVVARRKRRSVGSRRVESRCGRRRRRRRTGGPAEGDKMKSRYKNIG